MPDNNKKQSDLSKDKGLRDNLKKTRNLLGQISLGLYGTDRKSQSDDLVSRFDKIMASDGLSEFNKTDGSSEITKFINDLFDVTNKRDAQSQAFRNQLEDISSTTTNNMTAFLEEIYRNKKLKQVDIKEVTDHLVELREAVAITRDTIITPDVVEGRISRDIFMDDISEEEKNSIEGMVEAMEKKMNTQNIIKNFIITNTLTYGEYYIYNIPYKEIFTNFIMQQQKQTGVSRFIESGQTLLECVYEQDKINNNVVMESIGTPIKVKKQNNFIESTYDIYTEKCLSHGNDIINKDEFKKTLTAIMGNIIIDNNPIPLPIITEGYESVNQYMNEYVNESGDQILTEAEQSSKKSQDLSSSTNLFNDFKSDPTMNKGLHLSGNIDNTTKSDNNEFKDVKDCYVKPLNPINVIKLQIMNQTIGYYNVIEDNNSVTKNSTGRFGEAIYADPFNPSKDEHTIIAAIAEKIVQSFDKKFLEKNLEFKQTIVEAIQYFNITNKRVRFQFIPAEYMSVFKIDQDENGNGVSMLDNAIRYARLYLTLLMFKVMTIITQSNDTRVNYIRQSGIDKDLTNRIQKIVRKKQARTVNINDLWSYTAVVNKVGNGNEMYIPAGRNNERAYETEILQGQDVQLHTDLLDALKNAYIMATGVPAAIINYLSEADFAKVVEQNNTKFLGRVVNFQLDFNRDITTWYKKLIKWCTNIDDNMIDKFHFVIPPPKANNNAVKNELLQSYDQYRDFVCKLELGEDYQNKKEYPFFNKYLAKDYIPALDYENIEKMLKQSQLDAVEESSKPKKPSADEDDIGLGDPTEYNL